MASPAPVFGGLRLCLLVVAEPRLTWRSLLLVFESNSLTVSRTRDFRSEAPEAVVGLTGPRVGEALTLPPLTGEGLADSFDSSLLGREIGRGMRDLDADEGLLTFMAAASAEVVVLSLQTQLEQQQ